VREITFEGQAAISVEQMASQSPVVEGYDFPFAKNELDFRPSLQRIIEDRLKNRDKREIARSFHAGLAAGLAAAVVGLSNEQDADAVVVSGGVFQNELLLRLLKDELNVRGLHLWTNRLVPTNDGGISLGQAAIAAFSRENNSARQERAAEVAQRS
jgi:hydrogenase maturation protein HypF